RASEGLHSAVGGVTVVGDGDRDGRRSALVRNGGERERAGRVGGRIGDGGVRDQSGVAAGRGDGQCLRLVRAGGDAGQIHGLRRSVFWNRDVRERVESRRVIHRRDGDDERASEGLHSAVG